MKKFLIIIIIIFITILIIFWFTSYIKCEIITNKHGYEFSDLYKETGIISNIDNFKVLKYDDYSAIVYYVSKTSGNTVSFIKENDNWSLSDWHTVWSKSGSASGIIWPYIR